MRSPDNDGLSRPNSAAGKLQRILLELLREHEREKDGLPTYPRFLYYELVARRIISKVKTTKGASSMTSLAGARSKNGQSRRCRTFSSVPGAGGRPRS